MKYSQNKNILLTMLETIVTVSVLSVPIMTPFYLGLGLTQKQIALTQIVFTVVVMILNLPLGWVADRFSRKWANIIGDLLCASALLCYSRVQSFWNIVMCECLFGIGAAFSQGVDSSLLKHFCDKEDKSGKLFKRRFSQTAVWCEIITCITMLIGGPIGAISFRLAIGLSSITYFIGALISLFVVDDSPRLEKSEKGVLRQMVGITAKSMKQPKLRRRIFAYMVAREITHGIMWVFSPLMMQAGVPLSIVSVGWALKYVACTFGAWVAGRKCSKLRDWQIFTFPIAAIVISGAIMLIDLNIATIWLFTLFGIAQGWVSASMMPMVKEYVDAKEQVSVESFVKICSQFMYIVSVWIINAAADIDIRYSILATILIFVPLAIPIALKLKKE